MDIEDMINNVANQDFSKSQTYFDAIMQDKMNDALEQEKISMAAKIFNLGKEDEPDEDEDDDFDDEDYDQAAEDAMDDEDDEDEE